MSVRVLEADIEIELARRLTVSTRELQSVLASGGKKSSLKGEARTKSQMNMGAVGVCAYARDRDAKTWRDSAVQVLVARVLPGFTVAPPRFPDTAEA